MGMDFVAGCTDDELSVAVTVTVKEPDLVGRPLITPTADICSPGGSPVAETVWEPIPPVTVTVNE
jgi:hypothetical protein